MAAKSPTITLDRAVVELAFRALDDAYTEIEAMEKSAAWYSASQKMMDRLEKSMTSLKEALK